MIAGLALSLITGTASAALFDFQHMANTVPGESAHQPLTVTAADFSVDINGYKSTGLASAYLDSGRAGLGVCTPNGSGICGADDNVDEVGEFLEFVFTQDVYISDIWFNNNHDPDYSLDSDHINIDGANTLFSDSMKDAAMDNQYRLSGTTFVAAGDTFTIGYVDEQFYVGAMKVSTPEPAIPALIALGLIGIGLSTRKKKA